MFPLHDNIKSERFQLVTIFLIVFTGYVFLREIFSFNLDAFIKQYALIPSLISFSNPTSLLPFVTAIFLHGGWLHILSNMWFLWVFGDNVEGRIGKLPYLFLYLFAGVVGNFVQYIVTPHSDIPLLGASGAIAGILGAYYVFFPYAKIKTLFFIFFFVTLFDISAPFMLGYWFLLQLFSGATAIGATSATGGVAFMAHVGGFLTGVFFAKMYGTKQQVLEGEIVS